MVIQNLNYCLWISLCTHEPVAPEKILVIFVTFYGMAMSDNSSEGNHCQYLEDEEKKELQTITSLTHIVPNFYLRKYPNWVMFWCTTLLYIWFCIYGSTQNFKAVNLEYLSSLTSTFVMHNFPPYQNKP